jgi:hypothetical protein
VLSIQPTCSSVQQCNDIALTLIGCRSAQKGSLTHGCDASAQRSSIFAQRAAANRHHTYLFVLHEWRSDRFCTIAVVVRWANPLATHGINMAIMRALQVLTLLFAAAVILSQQATAVKSLAAAQQNELELQQAQVQ